MAIPTKALPKSRGPGLDFRTRPETGGGGDTGGSDDAMVQKLSQAAQESFGVKQPAEDKKKIAAQSAGGTTRNAGTSTASPSTSTGTTSSESDAAQSRPGQVDDGAQGEAASTQTGDAAGTQGVGSGVDEREAATETLDALALLNKGLPKEGEDVAQQPELLKEKEQPAGDKSAKPKTEGSALRNQLEKTIAEKRDLEKRLQDIEKREDPRIKDLTTAWEAEKKEREKLEAKIAQLDYSQSPKFRKDFVEPYEAAFSDTLARIRGMTTAEGTKLTQEEVETIMVGGQEEAFNVIASKFDGGKADVAKSLVTELYSLDRARARALRQSEGQALEQRRNNEAQFKARQEQIKQLWERERDGRLDREKALVDLRKSDKKLGRLLDEGGVLADAAFFRPQNVTDEQAVAIMAETRTRAALYPLQRELYLREKARADALEADLVKYRGHSPGNGEPPEEGEGQHTSKHQEGTMEWAKEKLAELAS